MIKGIKIATANCGIKYKNRDDLLLVAFDQPVAVAGTFTTSSTRAASVLQCQKNIKQGKAKALIVNAGNANAFTGKDGEEIVNQIIKSAAKTLNCAEDNIFTSSTGVIGEIFDYKLITNLIPNLVNQAQKADKDSFESAAKAIMTTDTKLKLAFTKSQINGKDVNIVGFAKGSGMIEPNMATMLSYIFTDAKIAANELQNILTESVDKSFNAITVDSDTSTNDTVLMFATGTVENDSDSKFLSKFQEDLDQLTLQLAKMIVVDGEGAKKLIEIEVVGADSKDQAKKTAKAIANSPLVKTAIAGADPNWGRVIMAIGKSCLKADQKKLIVKIGDFQLTKDGGKHPDYVEAQVHQYLKNSEVKIFVDLALENKNTENSAIVWTCDLNEEYIKINKDYRS